MEKGTDNARRDCCRPVPQMITSQVVSLSDSMVLRFVLLEGDEEKRLKIARRLCKFQREQRTPVPLLAGGPSSLGLAAGPGAGPTLAVFKR